MGDRYLNAQPGASIPPTASFEPIPVIARFVNLDGSECWKPCTAVRWSAALVLVTVGATFDKTSYTWLRAEDVARAIWPQQSDRPVTRRGDTDRTGDQDRP